MPTGGAAHVPTRAQIDEAAARIAASVRRTPTLELEHGAFGVPGRLVLKLEQLQHTGSFKVRGAFNRLLQAEVGPAGVVAASGGNHGLAVAYAARALGHRAEIFVPATSPAAKVERIRAAGARVHVVPGYYAEALAASEERVRETGALAVHAYDQPEVVAGQGTLGRELAEQARGLDAVLVAVGGGGLLAGIAAWFRGDVRVVGVEPERCPTLTRALEAGRPVDVEVGGAAADSLGAARAGTIALAAAERFVDRVVLVPDEAIVRARRELWSAARVVVEPGAAAPLAALLCGRYVPGPEERVALVLSGANTDPADLA
ncbi:MAG TPA: threonine/serine dehydratase [Actinomycetota bacterium]|nr:threonine/serine dehydratase [Actinomycetota bacterium]